MYNGDMMEWTPEKDLMRLSQERHETFWPILYRLGTDEE